MARFLDGILANACSTLLNDINLEWALLWLSKVATVKSPTYGMAGLNTLHGWGSIPQVIAKGK
jgi:hypothetical protein